MNPMCHSLCPRRLLRWLDGPGTLRIEIVADDVGAGVENHAVDFHGGPAPVVKAVRVIVGDSCG